MTVRIGIIGIGAIAENAFLPGFAEPDSPQAARGLADWNFNGCPGAKVVMLASRDCAKLERVASDFGGPAITADWHELVTSPDVDAVCVTTPNYLHHEMTVAACHAGKHVLVEKPMALTMQEAREMVEAAAQANVVLMVQQSQRFFPVHEVAKQIVESGAIGDVLSMRARWSHGGPEGWTPQGKWFFRQSEAGHGTMFDLGIHKFDLMRFVTGKEVTEVSAFTATLSKPIQVEDHGIALLRFSDRALGVVEASWASTPNENSLKLYGTRGNLQVGLDATYPISVEFETRPRDLDASLPPGEWHAARFVPAVPGTSMAGGPFRHFVDCITTGGACIASGPDNLKSLAIALAAFQSAANGCVVKVPLS